MQDRDGLPFRAFALDFWNGTRSACEGFRSNAGITYPVLMSAGNAGVDKDYSTSYDAFFVIDSAGYVLYRHSAADGFPVWRPATVGPIVDAAIAELIADVGDAPPREAFTLQAAWPNPFNPLTRIPYSLFGEGEQVAVGLEILDIRGRLVRTLVSETQTTGRDYETVWDGRDNQGDQVPSGTYLSRLRVGSESRSRLLTLIK